MEIWPRSNQKKQFCTFLRHGAVTPLHWYRLTSCRLLVEFTVGWVEDGEYNTHMVSDFLEHTQLFLLAFTNVYQINEWFDSDTLQSVITQHCKHWATIQPRSDRQPQLTSTKQFSGVGALWSRHNQPTHEAIKSVATQIQRVYLLPAKMKLF